MFLKNGPAAGQCAIIPSSKHVMCGHHECDKGFIEFSSDAHEVQFFKMLEAFMLLFFESKSVSECFFCFLGAVSIHLRKGQE